MQENVPFVPCVGLSQVPVISGVPLSACSLPSYVTSVGGTGRSYTFLNWTLLVSGSKLEELSGADANRLQAWLTRYLPTVA